MDRYLLCVVLVVPKKRMECTILLEIERLWFVLLLLGLAIFDENVQTFPSGCRPFLAMVIHRVCKRTKPRPSASASMYRLNDHAGSAVAYLTSGL